MKQEPTKDLKVFIVEDSEKFSRWIRDELVTLGGVAIEEIGGVLKTVRQKILDGKPDVIILDLGLSDGSGIDILREIMARKIGTKVIVFTNYPYQVFQKQCLNLGADYFFDKMYDADKLALAVKDIQANRDLNRSFQHGKSVMI